MASSARAIRSSASRGAGCRGRFVAAIFGFEGAGLAMTREPVLRGFFDIFRFPDGAPISRLVQCRKQSK
jgi:hypothetical protein